MDERPSTGKDVAKLVDFGGLTGYPKLALIRQWLKAMIVEPSGVRVNPHGKGTPQGGVISPLLSNIYLHWFETSAAIAAKASGQVMKIVRYADDPSRVSFLS